MDREKFEVATAANMELIKSKGYGDKYNHYGVYSISIDEKIVYIGKSRNMLKRIAQHMVEIENNQQKNMYKVLREARKIGYKISFNTVVITKEDDNDLGQAEAYWIRYYSPCLNIQYPHLDDYRKYDYVPYAKVITTKEILDNYVQQT